MEIIVFYVFNEVCIMIVKVNVLLNGGSNFKGSLGFYIEVGVGSSKIYFCKLLGSFFLNFYFMLLFY